MKRRPSYDPRGGPVWARGLVRAQRVVEAGLALEGLARDALVQGLVPRARWGDLALTRYARTTTYLPGSPLDDKGLFPWEERLLAAARLPPKSRVVVLACGGGRELRALRARGYVVAGAEPCRPLLEAAQRRASPGEVLVEARLEDLIPVARGEAACPASALARERADLVVLGWGAYSHLLEAADRKAVLGAVRALWPTAPVMLSFVAARTGRRDAYEERARDAWELWSARLGGSFRADVRLSGNEGFYVELCAAAVAREAEAAGYEVEQQGRDPYGHALLRPRPLPGEAMLSASIAPTRSATTGTPPSGEASPAPRLGAALGARLAGLVLAADAQLRRAGRAGDIVLDECLSALLPPEARPAMTAHAYARADAYLPGGSVYEGGLFEWEERLLRHAPFPKSGHVLVLAAGAGREARALLHRGYRVAAAEPSERLYTALARLAAEEPRLTAYRLGYEDIVRAAAGEGPTPAVVGERFDAVLLGWGSLAHLPEDDDVERTLRALRLLWPRAPLAASFFVPGPPRAEGNGLEARLRRGVRRVLGRHGAGRDEQVLYYTGGGFLRLFTPERMTALAAAAGYDLTAVELDDQPCALFVPRENALLAAGSAR